MNAILKKQKVLCVFIYFLLGMQLSSSCSAVTAASEPTIYLLNVPHYGSRIENLTGVILNGLAEDYQIGVYIFVDGWRTKNVEQKNNDGYWICDITTQNNDWEATHIMVFLFHQDYEVPIIKNDKIIPPSLFENAISHKKVIRKPMKNR